MTFSHSGDLGDCIASLPAVKALGGGDYRITFFPNGQRESMRGERFDSIKPLLESQFYINSVEWTETVSNGAVDFSKFRTRYQLHRSLALQQAEFVGAKIDETKPWLHVNPSYHNRTVIARSSRYHNPIFPWRKIMDTLVDPIFVGLLQEHQQFEAYFGRIDYQPTTNLLELAQVIAGAKQLITNQTCAFWIGAGLGIPIVQESYLADLNSVIERPNCRYSRTVLEVNKLIESL